MSKSLDVISSNSSQPVRAAMACSILAIAIATSSAAHAQDTAAPASAAAPAPTASTQPDKDGSRLEEIVVTARKRTEKIDTIPLAITAMTAAKIDERNLKSIEDVAAFSPGFYTQEATGTGTGRNDRSFRQLTFRGIGANSTNVGTGAGGVGFLDGTPVLNSSLSSVQDLERIEVLRGPQGVYFGRSTFIGAVNYITKDPTDTWTGRVTGEYAEDNLVDLSGSISGPLADWASIRISARHFAKDGQYKTANAQRTLGSQSTNSISATLLLKPTEGLRIRTYFNHFEDSDGPPAQYTLGGKVVGAGASNCNLGGTFGPYYCGTVPQKADPTLISANLLTTPAIYNGLLKNINNYPAPFDFSDYLSDYGLKRRANQFSNKIDYTFGDNGPTLTAVSAYHEEHIVTLSDFTFRAGPSVISTSVGYKDYDWSQELRLVSTQNSRFRWVVGGNYVKLNNTTSGIIGQFATFGILNFCGCSGIGYTRAETPAGFAGLYYDLIHNLTLSLEGRYQADKISGEFHPTAGGTKDVSQTFKSFSPRVSLDYKLTPTSTVYALFSRGYKPGGFNQGILTQPQFVLDQFAATGAAAVYGQERLDNYEAGIKGSFLEGRLRASLDGYIGRYTGAQVPIPVIYATTQNSDGTPNLNGPLNSATLVRNIGSVDLKGVEFEAEAIVVPGLRLGATFAYTDTKIKQYFCIECQQILAQPAGYNPATSPISDSIQATGAIGKRLPGAPKITYTLSANYEQKLDNGMTAYIGGDYLFRGQYYAEAANVASSGSSEIFNARLGVRTKKFNIELFARNLFNNQSPSITYYPGDYFNSLTGSANSIRLGLPDKRRIGIRGEVNF